MRNDRVHHCSIQPLKGCRYDIVNVGRATELTIKMKLVDKTRGGIKVKAPVANGAVQPPDIVFNPIPLNRPIDEMKYLPVSPVW